MRRAKAAQEAEKKDQAPDKGEESKDKEDDQKSTPYHLVDRKAGSGPKRIGQYLELGEDIYSLFFVSTMHPDYIYYYHTFAEGNDENPNFPDDLHKDLA